MKKIIFLLTIFLSFVPVVFAQSLTIGWSVDTVYAETGSSGNQAFVRLTWNDGNTGQTHGIYSWQFNITSSSITITPSSVALHASIASNFNINTASITGGVSVSIWGKAPNRMLKDNGNSAASYLVLTLTFTAPGTPGSYNVTLTNAATAVKRTTSSPFTPSTQSVTSGTTTLNIQVLTSPSSVAPTFTGTGYTNSRKYGDINWDGSVNVADVTALSDVVLAKYSSVRVDDPENNWYTTPPPNYRYFYETSMGEDPIVYDANNIDNNDRTAADVFGSGGTPDNVLNLMDLATLQDAVTYGTWPSYAINPIQNQPAYITYDEPGFDTKRLANIQGGIGFDKLVFTNDVAVKFEVFNPGQRDSRIRIKVDNNSSDLKGLQIELLSFPFPGKLDVWTLPDAIGYKVAWARNKFNKIVILIYADDGKVLKQGSASYVTIVAPNLTVEQIISAEPNVISSIKNIAYSAYNITVSEPRGIFPTDYMLYQNYPNPFNPETKIDFEVPEYSDVKLIVWNSLGQKVKEIFSGTVDPNRYSVYWDGKDEYGLSVTSGVYFVTMYANSLEERDKAFKMTKKMIFMK